MTDVAFKEYFEHLVSSLDQRVNQRFEDFDRRHGQRFDLSDMAIEKAERTISTRLNSMNEFREALKDQANRMATRSEVQALDVQVQDIRREKANLDGRFAGISLIVSAGVSLVVWWLSRLVQ